MLIKTANLLYLFLHTIFMKKHTHVLIVILSILGFYNVQAQEKHFQSLKTAKLKL